MKNKLLIGKKAIEYMKANPMKTIKITDKDMLENVAYNYMNVPELVLDITEIDNKARLILLKFVEERSGIICLTLTDIQDPILLSRFTVEKESLLKIDSVNNMSILEFAEIYKDYKEQIKSGEMSELELKKMIMENCPIFATLPKNKVLDILLEN